MNFRRIIHSTACGFLLIANGPTASAHAVLDHAVPQPGATVSDAPREVSLWFSESLEAAFSSAEVTDSTGTRVDQGRAEVKGTTMRLGLKQLPPGNYRVHWRAVSADTHKVEGNFTFNVGRQ